MEGNPKLDARTRRLLSRGGDREAAGPQTVTVFLQGAHPLGEDELGALRASGAEIQVVAGDVVTADVPLELVPGIADHDFVLRVEASAPLQTEGQDGGAPPMPPLADAE